MTADADFELVQLVVQREGRAVKCALSAEPARGRPAERKRPRSGLVICAHRTLKPGQTLVVMPATKKVAITYERASGRKIRISVWNDGAYFVDNPKTNEVELRWPYKGPIVEGSRNRSDSDSSAED